MRELSQDTEDQTQTSLSGSSIVVMDAVALTEIRTPAVAVAGVLDRLQASSEPLECVIVGAGVQGRAVVDELEGVREIAVTFVSRSGTADPLHPWVESGRAGDRGGSGGCAQGGG